MNGVHIPSIKKPETKSFLRLTCSPVILDQTKTIEIQNAYFFVSSSQNDNFTTDSYPTVISVTNMIPEFAEVFRVIGPSH